MRWTLSPEPRSSFLPRVRVGLVLACVGFGVAPEAYADDVDVQLAPVAMADRRPRLTLRVQKPLATARLKLDGPAPYAKTLGPAAPGAELVFELPHRRAGTMRWQGALEVRFADGATGTMPLQFETQWATPPHIRVLSSRTELIDEHRVRVVSDRPTQRVDVEVYGDDGVLQASTSRVFGPAPAEEKLVVPWVPRVPGPPLRVRVTVFDPNDVFATSEAYPWTLSIPHEDVVFATGSAEIDEAERSKLDAARLAIARETQRYQKALSVGNQQVKLFIAGHTDSVGASASNRRLSAARAQALARWFRRHEIKIPIYFQGFGEDAPKIQRPDETDEPQNRRADYDIAVDSPTGSMAGWQAL